MTIKFRPLVLAASVAAALSAPLAMAENIKIAMIETMSGAFAPIGQNQLNTFQLVAEIANKEKWAGAGNTLEVRRVRRQGQPAGVADPAEGMRSTRVIATSRRATVRASRWR